MSPPDSKRPVPLDYSSPADDSVRNERRNDSVPGVASCCICAVSVFTVGAAAMIGGNRGRSEWLAIASGLSLLACYVAGLPLALGGLVDPVRRTRLAWIGLIANILWPVMCVLGFVLFERLD